MVNDMSWKNVVCVVSLFLLAHTGLVGQQNLSGSIRGVLSKSDSPYTIIADIIVDAGDTLWIDPGVELRFKQGTGLVIEGTVQAVGLEADSIRFTSAADTSRRGDWTGIFFRDNGGGTLWNCVIGFAATAVTTGKGELLVKRSLISNNNNGFDCLQQGEPIIEFCRIEKNINSGMRVINASPVVRFNSVLFNSDGGVESAIVLQNSSAQISNNLIAFNSNSGIDLINSSAAVILQNTISANDIGITLTDSDAAITNNIVALNYDGVLAEGSAPVLRYNNIWGHQGDEFTGLPEGTGVLSRTNARGDSADAGYNIFLDPQFYNPDGVDFRLLAQSPCIDAGDPANPAQVSVTGSAPDIGVYELNSIAVPVELSAFSFRDGILYWVTETESNNYGFYIEYAGQEGVGFEQIGFVPGRGTATTVQEYRFVLPENRRSGLFRLRQEDFDGRTSYSGVLRVQMPVAGLKLEQNYPNPFLPGTGQGTRIRFYLPQQADVLLEIFDVRGRLVWSAREAALDAGQQEMLWNGRTKGGLRVPAGTYFYRLSTGGMLLQRQLRLLH